VQGANNDNLQLMQRHMTHSESTSKRHYLYTDLESHIKGQKEIEEITFKKWNNSDYGACIKIFVVPNRLCCVIEASLLTTNLPYFLLGAFTTIMHLSIDHYTHSNSRYCIGDNVVHLQPHCCEWDNQHFHFLCKHHKHQHVIVFSSLLSSAMCTTIIA